MQRVVDELWSVFGPEPMSWIGFYIDQPDQPDDRRLTLGPRRDTPACSPIGLHGVCGQSLRESVIRIVRDVHDLGPNYIACDPRDQSEIVVPLLHDRGECWGVLDVDSWSVGTFDELDARRLCDVLEAAGFRVSRRISGATNSAPA